MTSPDQGLGPCRATQGRRARYLADERVNIVSVLTTTHDDRTVTLYATVEVEGVGQLEHDPAKARRRARGLRGAPRDEYRCSSVGRRLAHGRRTAFDPRQVLAIGEILVDFIVADGATTLEVAETFVARSGGAPANASVALARLGLDSAFCGVVGDDEFGVRLRTELAAEGVDTSRLRQSKRSRNDAGICLEGLCGRWPFPAVARRRHAAERGGRECRGRRSLGALVIGSVALSAQPARSAIERAVDLARQAGVPVVFDVNLRPTLWSDLTGARPACEEVARSSTLVKLSLDDAAGLYGPNVRPHAAIEIILSLGVSAVVLTDGERGCWFSSGSPADVRACLSRRGG